MLFNELTLRGAFVVAPERREDARGWFTRTFCHDEFAAHGLICDFVQCSTSFNIRRGTLRGMHFQRAPHEEIKLVRCTRGAVLDVMLDLRAGASTFRQWQTVELTEDNGLAVYVPCGFAHGFQTLTDNAEVFYQMAGRYCPDAAAGIRWDDPAFDIDWPIRPPILSDRDASHASQDWDVTSRPADGNSTIPEPSTDSSSF
jgi:dTDP-4-dehydrorhamnose 3,5-epimerase